jgi:hypothetical protein
MMYATGEHSIVDLSTRDLQPSRSTRAFTSDQPQLLTGEPRPVPFAITFPTGESVQITLLRSGEEPSVHWLVFGSLQKLAGLPTGWDSYGARPLNPRAVYRSVGLLTSIVPPGAPEPSVVPTRDGGVQFEWHRRGIDVEVRVPPVGEVSFIVADPNEEHEGEGIPDRALLDDAFARMTAAA